MNRTIPKESLVQVSLECASSNLNLQQEWNTLSLWVSGVSALASVAECPQLGARVAVLVSALGAVSKVIKSLSPATLILILLDALLLVAGQLVSIIALLTLPLGNFSILVSRPCGCAAGDDVLVVWAWDCCNSGYHSHQAGESQENSSGESHVQNSAQME